MPFENDKLFSMLSALKIREKRRFQRFLDSHYCNQREDVRVLCEHYFLHLEKPENLENSKTWQTVFPAKPFDIVELRLIKSYLTKLIERFLVIEETRGDTLGAKMSLAKIWRNRSAHDLHINALQEAEKILARQKTKNWEHLRRKYEWQEEWYRQAYVANPQVATEVGPVSSLFDESLLAMKLRQNCTLLAHHQVYDWEYEPGKLNDWLLTLSVNDLSDEPAIRIYWHCNQMLLKPEEESHFQDFKNLLVTKGQLFPVAEARDLQLQAINYGIRQVNKGNTAYFQDIIDIYKAGLEQGYLLNGKQLSRFTYQNIVIAALQIGDIQWAQEFIDEWTDALERRYRERMYNFCQAKIAYADQRYEDALPLLQQANYHDPLFNLGARALLLKIYFELKEWEVLESHLDAFQGYLRRKPGLGYHKENYKNLIRYTRKLLRLTFDDGIQQEQVKIAIQQEGNLTEKDWLLKQIKPMA